MTSPAQLLPLFVTDNVSKLEINLGIPWEFLPDPDLAGKLTSLSKTQRRELLKKPSTHWSVYSTIGGEVRNQIIGKDNPPAVVHGIAIDYDRKHTPEEMEDLIKSELPENLWPSYIEISLSGNSRLFWGFSHPVVTPGMVYCNLFLSKMHEKLHAKDLLRGYDNASLKPTERWTNGGTWYEFTGAPLDQKYVTGVSLEVSSSKDFNSASELPLNIIAAEVERRWPGRWKGPFEINQTGVRFWDSEADNPTGCQIKTDGMMVFTRPGFLSWGDILGYQWMEEQCITNLANVASDVFSDAKNYYVKIGGNRWITEDSTRLSRHFKSHGVSGVIRKGQTASDLDKVMHHIETINRVDAVGPVIHQPDGLIILDNGERLLNTSSLKALAPAAGLADTSKFPWTHSFLSQFFARQELLPLEHFLAWLQRAYASFLHQQPEKGQAVFITGPHNNGKNLISELIVKPLFGGRASNPYEYLIGNTTFSDDIFSAPLLAVNDEEAPLGRVRSKWLQKLKAIVVNGDHTYHPKFAPKSTIPWNGRFLGTNNDTPRDIGFIPEINSNSADKIMLFASTPYSGDFPNRWELKKLVGEELPHFARWLLDGFKAPESILIGGRMGVKSFHDPVILNLAKQQEASYDLLELLITWIEVLQPTKSELHAEPLWVGTPSRLLAELAVIPGLEHLVKGWDVHEVAQDLTALARQETFGVSLLGHGTASRAFKIDKLQLNRMSSLHITE